MEVDMAIICDILTDKVQVAKEALNTIPFPILLVLVWFDYDLFTIYIRWHLVVSRVLNALEIYASWYGASIVPDSYTGYKNILLLHEQISCAS